MKDNMNGDPWHQWIVKNLWPIFVAFVIFVFGYSNLNSRVEANQGDISEIKIEIQEINYKLDTIIKTTTENSKANAVIQKDIEYIKKEIDRL